MHWLRVMYGLRMVHRLGSVLVLLVARLRHVGIASGFLQPAE